MLVVFNAPPNAGKDFICDYLVEKYHANKVEFKKTLRELVKIIYSLTDEKLEWYYHRDNKEKKWDELGGKSIRECFIEVSEHLIKPFYGKEWFGEKLVDSLDTITVNVASDGGFKEEIEAVAKQIGEENILIIQIYADECSFDGDSRKYLDINGVLTYCVFNNKDERFIRDVEYILKEEGFL